MTGLPRASFPRNWAAAARHERDWREQSFPRLIAQRKIPADAAEANYQAWCAIVEWLEHGGASWSATPLVYMLGWPALEDAAEKQLADLDDKLTKRCTDAALKDHRDAIWCIHNTLVKQRELVTPTERAGTVWARPTAIPVMA